MRIQQPKSDYTQLGGGLDLVTPAIAMNPGRAIDSQNYEPDIAGKYRRIDGFERYDGQASPSGAGYWILSCDHPAAVAGNTITGAISAATAVVALVRTDGLVCVRLAGTFVSGENVTVSGYPVATLTSAAVKNGASTLSDHADYLFLAADDLRTFIQKVPGSGPIRGVWVHNDVRYAFRDNAGATAGDMYKATTAGWVQVVFNNELWFNAATGQISIGNTVTGGTSGASAVVINALLMTGTWTAAGVGSLVLGTITGGPFTPGEAILVGGVSKATATYGSTAITRAPGGKMEFDNHSFVGTTGTKKMYGCDGVNTAFEFDGTTYTPIRTGMTTDTPNHLRCHDKGFLFLAFNASVQYSGIGNPYAWTVVLGAGEFNTSDSVSCFLTQGGTSAGPAFAILTSGKTFILYGSSSADFKLVPSVVDIGFSPFTGQQVSNDAFGWTARGIQTLITTLTYGDFDYESVSHMIQPLITRLRGLEIASNTIKTKNQYRIYFSDGSALAVGLTGDKVSGILPLYYGMPVRCICTATLSTGQEVTYFGSDDGYVYQDNVGTSQDGSPIESWCRLAFNTQRSPRVRKSYKRAVLEVTADVYSQVSVTYDLGYGSTDISPSPQAAATALLGSGGYWNQFIWEQFNWDAQMVQNPVIPLDGTDKNISLLFYSKRAQDASHTLQGVTFDTIPRRLDR